VILELQKARELPKIVEVEDNFIVMPTICHNLDVLEL